MKVERILSSHWSNEGVAFWWKLHSSETHFFFNWANLGIYLKYFLKNSF